jgi:hypothetical protein
VHYSGSDHGSYGGISMTAERVERRRTAVWRLTGRAAPMGDDGVATLDALTAWREILGGLVGPMEAAWPYRGH